MFCKIMRHSNDNTKPDLWDDPGFELAKNTDLFRVLLKHRPSVFIESNRRIVKNWLWCLKFEAAFKEVEVQTNRDNIRIVE